RMELLYTVLQFHIFFDRGDTWSFASIQRSCALHVFFFLMLRPPPRSTLFPTRRSSDLRGRDTGRGCGRASSRRGAQVHSAGHERDRKSTRLNSSHVKISYAVFCLKKKIPSIAVAGMAVPLLLRQQRQVTLHIDPQGRIA